MAVLRENYQSDIHLPLSFQKLYELAMDNMFRGYVKKQRRNLANQRCILYITDGKCRLGGF